MSLKDLEKYQEIGRRTPVYFNYKNKQEELPKELTRCNRSGRIMKKEDYEKREKVIDKIIDKKSINSNIIIQRTPEEALQEEYDKKDNFYNNDYQLDYYLDDSQLNYNDNI